MFILKTSQGVPVPGPGLGFDQSSQKLRQLETRKGVIQGQLSQLSAQQAAKQKALKNAKAARAKLVQETRAKEQQLKGQINSLDSQIRTEKQRRDQEVKRKTEEKLKLEGKDSKDINQNLRRANDLLGSESYDSSKKLTRGNRRGQANIVRDRSTRTYSRAAQAEANGDREKADELYAEADRLENLANRYEAEGEQLQESGVLETIDEVKNSDEVVKMNTSISDLEGKKGQATQQLSELKKNSNTEIAALEREIESLGGSLDELAQLEESNQGDLATNSGRIQEAKSRINSQLGGIISRLESSTNAKQEELTGGIASEKREFIEKVVIRDNNRTRKEKFYGEGSRERFADDAGKFGAREQREGFARKNGWTMEDTDRRLSRTNINISKAAGLVSDNASNNADVYERELEYEQSEYESYYETGLGVYDDKKENFEEEFKQSETDVVDSQDKVKRLYGAQDKLASSLKEVNGAYQKYMETGDSKDFFAFNAKLNAHKNLLSGTTVENPGFYEPKTYSGTDRSFYESFDDPNANRAQQIDNDSPEIDTFTEEFVRTQDDLDERRPGT